MKILPALALGMSLASPALASSPIDYLEGDWFTTTTIYDAAEDGSDLVVEGKERCERSGNMGFSCALRSIDGQLIIAFFWSMDPKSFETHGYYVDFIDDRIQTRRGAWDPKSRTWKEYSPGSAGGVHIISDLTDDNRHTAKVYADDNGKPGVLTIQVELRR